MKVGDLAPCLSHCRNTTLVSGFWRNIRRNSSLLGKKMALQFSDQSFLADVSSPAATSQGDGAVLVPLSVFGDSPPDSVSVVDFAGREVSFVLCGRTYFTDSAAGTEVFAGWSYWEDEASDYPGSPAVQLFVLSPDFAEADYREVYDGWEEAKEFEVVEPAGEVAS